MSVSEFFRKYNQDAYIYKCIFVYMWRYIYICINHHHILYQLQKMLYHISFHIFSVFLPLLLSFEYGKICIDDDFQSFMLVISLLKPGLLLVCLESLKSFLILYYVCVNHCSTRERKRMRERKRGERKIDLPPRWPIGWWRPASKLQGRNSSSSW